MAAGSRKSGSRGARGSRGGGGGSGGGGPRGTLGTLLRTTLAQAGVVREMLERGAREGRARLDDARQGRRREQALARLGEAVLDAVKNGEPQVADLYDLPEVADALADVEGLEAGAEEPVDEDEDRGRGAVWVPPGIRDRFDRRPPRPPPIETDGDGTVSSKDWKPRPASAEQSERRRTPEAEPGARFAERATPAPAPARKGGIQFTRDDDDDDDEDLAQYMHPDDVPEKKKD